MEEIWIEIQKYLYQLPDFIFAIGIFLVGWLIAYLVSKVVKTALSKWKWDNKLFESLEVNPKWHPEVVISKIVYYLLLILALAAALYKLNLIIVAQPFMSIVNELVGAVPNIIKAALILLAGWIVATLVKMLILKGGTTLRINSLLHKWKIVNTPEQALESLKAVSRIAFYLILLLFIPGVLSSLNITAISQPFSNMMSQFLLFLPKLFAAALILLVGWIVAKIVREIVTNLLKGLGLEKLANKLHLNNLLEKTSLPAIIGTIVYILILIPVVITALQALELSGISEPAVNMLETIFIMLPNIFVAILLVLIGVWIGKWVGQLVTSLLERLGFNSLASHLGIKAQNNTTITMSQIVGRLTQIIIIVLFVTEALQGIKLAFLVNIFEAIIAYLPNLLVAVIILGIGFFLGNFVQNMLRSIVDQKWKFLHLFAKYGIITISIFMALDQLGVAQSIVSSAFVIVLSGFALAFGLSFGLGGREFVADKLKKWQSLNSNSNSNEISQEINKTES